jgi:hypothetical protein
LKVSLVVLLTITMIMTNQTTCFAEILPKPPQESREELYHDLFITLLSPYIDTRIDEYYSKLFTISPTVYGYMIDIISVERIHGYRHFSFFVTLEVTPVVGPHISVGKDRLVFEIGAGGPKLLKFEHLEMHELPEHWQNIIKK